MKRPTEITSNVLTKMFDRLNSSSAWSFNQAVSLERPNRLSYKEGMRTRWLTVKSDGTLEGGITIDIANMNATDPLLADESREERIDRALRVRNFLSNKGFACEVLEDGVLLAHAD